MVSRMMLNIMEAADPRDNYNEDIGSEIIVENRLNHSSFLFTSQHSVVTTGPLTRSVWRPFDSGDEGMSLSMVRGEGGMTRETQNETTMCTQAYETPIDSFEGSTHSRHDSSDSPTQY